ncbi:hypothetical protein ATANTOWER_030870 [Ataeniobius toweri]|uniref:Death domain-associated protein 6 n=1 Tax=Ataeniobius toweri TaxID=208326 RepID=A0ABU7BVG3_9TELE|nr:hypothetical protein [Ataeniobius toweri]
MADKIIVLDDDDDDEEKPQPSCSAPTSSLSKHQAKKVSSPTHITHAPFSSTKKNENVLQIENQKLFDEFVQHCTPLTKDCPEVLTFLHTKHAKACSDYLSSVEFRNTLGRCLTRAQACVNKTFVYINELCTVLKQHALKKRQTLSKVEPSASESGTHQSTSASLKSKDKIKCKTGEEEDEEEQQPSGSGEQGDMGEEDQEAERKAKRALRKQIAYLENLLMLYNDEIYRLQQAELSLDDMETEDSTYIQEHKLKRKMMKIYEKLCELKGCSTLTGRVIEQRIKYAGTRYPEINKRIERFINSPEAHRNPPDYPDILHQVLRANERHNLCLSRKQLNQIAQEAFRETGSCMQERRHLDLVYNFGSRLTDTYKPATDPALADPTLMRKLRSNREVALSRLEEVITKYAVKQDDTEEHERLRRMDKDKENQKLEEEAKTKQSNGVSQTEDEEDDDDEEDESSDPDIEEELKASTQQHGADDEDDNDNEADEACDDGDNKEDQTYDQKGSVSEGGEKTLKDEDDPVSDETQVSPMSDFPSPKNSPSQSESMQADEQQPLSNGDPAALQQFVDSSNQLSPVPVKDNRVSRDPTEVPAAAATNGNPSPERETITVEQSDTQTANGTSPPPSPRTTRSQKRKREERMSLNSRSVQQKISCDSDADIPLDMGVICCSSPQKEEPSLLDTPTKDPISSSQSTPPPKKNKVNVATQCDPDEIIVLSDSE